MASRMQKVSPFQAGQSSNEKGDKNPSVKVRHDVSKEKHAGGNGALKTALDGGMAHNPARHTDFSHNEITVSVRGQNYNPAGEFGTVSRTGAGKGVYSYGGAPNKKGENALGHALGRSGEKSGYPKFTPKSGGKKP
jgi:hypothetical protein